MNQITAHTGQHLSVTFTGAMCTDDMALVLEVIAGEIRRGLHAGNESGFAWQMNPARGY